ncbi:MAG: flavin reductase [Fibrobacter sp.]|nr:flavin reductase [Fibrobacter sp.]
MSFKQISPEELNQNPFVAIGSEWMLIAAEKGGKTNAMTASWGGVGIMWGKPAAFVFIRQTRYTKEFVDAVDHFTLNFFGGKFKKELGYFGRVSGRDEDKIAKTGMAVTTLDNVPVFNDATTVFVCRKMYTQKLDEAGFIDRKVLEQNYEIGSSDSMHSIYIAEIEKILVKE